MRKILLTIAAIGFFCFASFAQAKTDTIQQLQNSIEKLEALNKNLTNQLSVANGSIQKIDKKLSATADSLNILKNNLANTNSNLQTIADNLGVKIQETSDKASADLSSLSKTVSKSTLYWIIAVLFIALLSVLLFGWLKKQLSKEKMGLSDQIKRTSDSLREEQLKLDGQLIKLLDTQMQLMNEERQTSSAKTDDIDHSLALKVADEIVRIEKNLVRIEGNDKGVKPIQKALERIRDNFSASGYEMVQLLNKEYDVRDNIDVINFITDSNIPTNKKIITRIIRPQVNYNGVLIQKAQVDVSQN